MNELTGRELLSESLIENKIALLLEADRDVQFLEEQPDAVPYRDAAGTPRRHTFDFRAILQDGTRVAIAVKDASRVASSGIRQTLELIKVQVGFRFAERFVLRTQNDAPRSRVANAKLILLSRKNRDNDAVEAVATLAHRLRGSVRIVDLLECAGLGTGGFISVVALIDDGLLELAEPGRISAPDARVRHRLPH